MEAGDRSRFRTDDPAAIAETIARCDKPDLVVRIAYQCTEHRRYVLRRAADTAATFRGELAELLWWFSPWPDRLEVIEIWAGGDDRNTPLRDRGRAKSMARMYAVGFAMLGDLLAWSHLVTDRLRVVAFNATLVALGLALVPAVRWCWRWATQRQTRHLDELSALELVTRRLAKGAARKPAHAPFALYLLHRSFSDLLPRDGEPDTFPWPEIFAIRLDRRRRWSALFDSHDPQRDVCYYRIKIFKRSRLEKTFMAELAGDIRTLEPRERHAAVRTRLAASAAAGKTNTAFVGPITGEG